MQMKNLILFISGLSLISLLSSCGDFQQELILNANGSGRLETSFDMGEMMSMVKGFEEMAPSEDSVFTKVEDKELSTETESTKDPMEAIIEKVTNPEYAHEFDTMMSFQTIVPDSIKKDVKDYNKYAPHIKIRVKSPANSEKLVVGLVSEFKDEKHLQELHKFLAGLDANTTSIVPGAGAGSLQTESFLSYTSDLKAGWITIDSMDYSSMASEMMMSPDGNKEDESMMEMLFGSSKIRTIIHVPGEVQSCTYSGAILTKDNRVIVEFPLMTALKTGYTPSFTIRFTPKK